MTPEDKARLRALCEAATSGPWDVSVVMSTDERITWRPGGHVDPLAPICHMRWTDGLHATNVMDDAAFIAEARTALPLLLDEVVRLEGENERMRGLLLRSTRHMGSDRVTCYNDEARLLRDIAAILEQGGEG